MNSDSFHGEPFAANQDTQKRSHEPFASLTVTIPMAIEISQIIRSKGKTLTIIVKNDGFVIVRAPMRTPGIAIRMFVEQHSAWVEKKQAQIRSAMVTRPKQYAAGEIFLFLGKSYPLEIVKCQKKDLVLVEGFKLAESAVDRAAIVFESWYRDQAKEILQERVDFYANRYGFEYQGIKITSARTRWGSCSFRGSLNFSWRLILAPMEQVDYVVVHELVHIVHHNHSKRFWKKVERIMPDFKQRKTWLREHALHLMV
jgi:predicted metal-dependent hydrolase